MLTVQTVRRLGNGVYKLGSESRHKPEIFLFHEPCRPVLVPKQRPVQWVRHTANVPGRIRLMVVSIITINVISVVGVPWGT
jgi:hypothetical protein